MKLAQVGKHSEINSSSEAPKLTGNFCIRNICISLYICNTATNPGSFIRWVSKQKPYLPLQKIPICKVSRTLYCIPCFHMDKEEVVFCVKLGLELGNRCGIVTFVLDIYLYYKLLEAIQFTPQPKNPPVPPLPLPPLLNLPISNPPPPPIYNI